jgi:hypothetical protein
MKVCIATKSYDYEGSDVLGLFYTMEDAKAFCEKQEESPLEWFDKDGSSTAYFASGTYFVYFMEVQ